MEEISVAANSFFHLDFFLHKVKCIWTQSCHPWRNTNWSCSFCKHLLLTHWQQLQSFSAPVSKTHRESLLCTLAVRNHAQDKAFTAELPTTARMNTAALRRTVLSPLSNGRPQGTLSAPGTYLLTSTFHNFQLNTTSPRFYPLPSACSPQLGQGDDRKLQFKKKSRCFRVTGESNPQILPMVLKNVIKISFLGQFQQSGFILLEEILGTKPHSQLQGAGEVCVLVVSLGRRIYLRPQQQSPRQPATSSQ